ncbi:PREDICTED: uncharacterized protein LOC109356308 [Lupinus angustifolius]|uniref:uncharacterized protein LOC109356308 n=1 Tax=Lupinus angustifolius TaxID=3871 RepID=UPI00092E25A8|nr:PREDICTED: uncharacterized protein LOC109356308 [Lupinus angustifolius]
MVELDVRADERGFPTTTRRGQNNSTTGPIPRASGIPWQLPPTRSKVTTGNIAKGKPGIDPSFACHRLTTKPGAKPVAQRRRKMGTNRTKEVASKVAELLEAGFIREITYTTWLANVVLVKKPSGKWRMCVDYTDLNKIPMYPPDQEKNAFITDQAAYCYTVMPFGLKNAGATYQRMLSNVFTGQTGEHMEVYMDDMIAKSLPGEDLVSILESIFQQLRKYNMWLNPEKCTFGVEAGKFLGFLLTSRGIEANPSKCQTIIDMRNPSKVQQLNGRLAALSRFLPSAAKHSLPLFQLLKKSKKFEWTESCEAAFDTFKQYLAAPPILSKPLPEEILYVYLAVSDGAVAAVLIRETAEGQSPVYFTSKALQGPELRYQKLEKVAYALLVAARRLRQYFQSHTTIVRTNQPIRQILHKPELAGRMITWSIELSQFDIRFEPRTTIKSQVLSDFVAELAAPEGDPEQVWTIFVDGSSNPKGSRADILLENGQGVTIEHFLTFTFPTSNNQAEYEACITGLQLAKEVGARKVLICSDSQLVVSQVSGAYQTKDALLGKYLLKVKELMADFDEATIQHVPRESNARADILSKLASTKCLRNNRSVVQGTIYHPSVLAVERKNNGSSDVPLGIPCSGERYIDEDSPPPYSNALVQSMRIMSLEKFTREVVGITRFGIPSAIVTDKGTQFADRKFQELLSDLHIKQHFTSVEHPQTNGQAEAANKVILKGLKKRLDESKANWPDQLHHVLWAYRTTPHSTTDESPFNLTYGAEAMIPVKIGEPTWRTIQFNEGNNQSLLRNNLDEVEEIRERAHLKEESVKKKTAAKFNSSIVPRQFSEGTLVLRRANIGRAKGK